MLTVQYFCREGLPLARQFRCQVPLLIVVAHAVGPEDMIVKRPVNVARARCADEETQGRGALQGQQCETRFPSFQGIRPFIHVD